LIPYQIETALQHKPWANWLVCVATVASNAAQESGIVNAGTFDRYFVLDEGHPAALVGHLFAHSSHIQLIGSMIFLWMFGNAVCAAIGNLFYLTLYLLFGVMAGMIHLAADGAPVFGPGGAVCGIAGLAFAFYPVNRVALIYSFKWTTPCTFFAPLWGVVLYWAAWDALSMRFSAAGIAYWSHLGGAVTGLVVGGALLACNCVEFGETDNLSLLDLILRRPPARLLTEIESGELPAAPSLPPVDGPVLPRSSELLRPGRAAAHLAPRPTIRLSNHSAPPLPVVPPPPPLPGAIPRTPRVLTSETPVAPLPFALPPALPAAPPRAVGRLTAAPSETGSSLPGVTDVRRASAWPDSLPEGTYYYFDGAGRYGPVDRQEFLARISAAPETSQWWYWTEGLVEWRRFADAVSQFEIRTPGAAAR
jgi:membrane associated rhomboid family serine protease